MDDWTCAQVLDDVLKEICTALLGADVNVRLVQKLRTNIKATVNIKEQPVGVNKKRLIHNVYHIPRGA